MTLKSFMVVILIVLLPISLISQLSLYNVIGWNYAGAWGITDKDKTGMRIEQGPTSEDSVMRINNYGWTTEPGGSGTGWALQNSFGKFQLARAQYPWPDEILIDLKVLDTTNTYLLGVAIALLDTTNGGLAGYLYHSIPNITSWQTIKLPWFTPLENRYVSMIGMDFPLYSHDSAYVGLEIQVNNLRFVYKNGDTILVDPFQYTWPKPVGISDEKQTPSEFVLSQNYPNPFNPSTKIKFTVPVSGQVSLIVYNSLGQEIKTLVSEEKNIGNYEVSFDASNLPSGIYFYKLQAGDFVETKKMLLLK